MIETLPVKAPASDLPIAPEVLSGFAAFHSQIEARSQIVWAEHCSECAYPMCYETCAFYTPRADLHCRRFEAGIQPLSGDQGLGLFRIRFRQWGKLEGRGTIGMTPLARAQQRGRADARAAYAIATVPAPYALKRKLAARWNLHKAALAGHPATARPDAFVVEAWSADGRDHPFTLTFLNLGETSGQMFQARFEARSAYGRLTVPIRDIEGHVDLAAPFLVQIEPVGEAAGRDVVFGTCDFVALAADRPRSSEALPDADSRPVKVVVWDLDETLWTGTLAEDGAAGVRVRPEAAAAVRALDARGVLQSVASKNDAPEAMAALARAGLADYFLHPQIHWGPKSQSIAAIAQALDLGLDSFVFIDDQPFERAEVQERRPAVRVLAHTDVTDLLSRRYFDLPVTPESRQRRALYQAEARRIEAFETAAEDYLGFLRQSDIRLLIRPLDAADVERAHELSQRTNQLNFRGAKYTRQDVQAMLAPSPERSCLTVRCADRFGDYGLIGLVVLDLRQGEIADFFMSCRVQRKRVEQALFAWIADEVRARGHATLSARHRPSDRNAATRAMLTELGFACVDDGGEQVWRRGLAEPFEDADVVKVTAAVHAEAL